MKSFRLRRLALAAIGLLVAQSARAEEDLTIYYQDRPPYSSRQGDGTVHGLTADVAAQALAAAGVAFHWVDMPSARQMAAIKGDRGRACGLGWFKNPERETFAKFTRALYHDRPMVVVARSADSRFGRTLTVARLFTDKSLTLLVKNSYSYGAEIDEKIASLKPRLREDSSENRTMLQMISRQRVDYMVMAEEEATDLLASPDIGQGLAIYHLDDAPPGQYRYLMCARSVPDDVIARINQAIAPAQ